MKIIGICLIKNEECFIEKVIKNVIDFCDELIVLDNYSSDQTWKIINDLKLKYSNLRIYQIKSVTESHSYIENYANTDTWIFRVDGDELYDRAGLLKFKKELSTGKYDSYYNLQCPCLNVEKMSAEVGRADGYLSRLTSLTNFSLLESWSEPNGERLHGENRIYNKKYLPDHKKFLVSNDFNLASLRCLHLCFIKRSSVDTIDNRLNPAELRWGRVVNFVRNLFCGRLSTDSYYKNKYYRTGKLVTINVSDFFA